MKVERKRQKVFEPIVITLETKREAQYMQTIAYVGESETLRQCCKALKQPVDEVDVFGGELGKKLDNFLDC